MTHKQYIYDVPNGKNVVLFIHGIIGTPNHFKSFVDGLPDDYAVYNLLLDGHGKTARDFGRSSMEKWKEQVNSIVEDLAKRYKNIIIVAHSMGSLFAIDCGIKFPEKVKLLFLLNVPLKATLKFSTAVNSLKLVFGLQKYDDIAMQNQKNACSIQLTKKLWLYIGWIPRYMELFREIKATRGKIKKIKNPCYAFQSKNDELVSEKAVKYLKVNEDIKIKVLENSGHFAYSNEDNRYMLEQFESLIMCYAEKENISK